MTNQSILSTLINVIDEGTPHVSLRVISLECERRNLLKSVGVAELTCNMVCSDCRFHSPNCPPIAPTRIHNISSIIPKFSYHFLWWWSVRVPTFSCQVLSVRTDIILFKLLIDQHFHLSAKLYWVFDPKARIRGQMRNQPHPLESITR